MPGNRLYLLGPVRVSLDNSDVTLKSAKAQALLALVGCEQKSISRGRLASILWESFPQERAWANLRHALHQLKSKAPELLEVTDTEVSLKPGVWVDIHHQESDTEVAGEFCQGLDFPHCPSFETWVAGQRSRWRDRTLQALLDRASESESDAALEAAHQALNLDPLSERAHALVIRLLRERGDFAAARRQWDACLRTTLQELGTVPSILSCWGPALNEDAACRIYLLGQPRLVVNGAITALPYQKTSALLAYLACCEEPVSRQEARDLFWPGAPPDKAAANLRHALHFLKKCVGDVLQTHQDSLWLDPARFWLDTHWLEKSQSAYESLGRFCEGMSLPDCPKFDQWLLSQRQKYETVRESRSVEAPLVTGNLPAQLTTLVGASTQLEEAQSILGQSRLLTLVGPAGVGKTRLAMELGRLQQQEQPVWLVEFGSLFDAEKVIPRLASALGLSESPGEDLWQQIDAAFKSQEATIVLDNCEHLITSTAELACTLLRRLPHLKIIATSRELLRVPGESVLTLAPLETPTGTSLAEVSASPAAELFVTRARASRPQFKLTEQNAPLVADICRRLDGLPLAIELAAVRTRALSTQQIADGLRDRFRLLRGGPRTVPQRQQTLEQALNWSYNLLTEEEQMVFSRLAVLAAGFDLEAASFVAMSEEEADLTLDILSALIDRSLVICRESDSGFRYAMLETVRDFAYRKLMEGGEEESICARHLTFFFARAFYRQQPGVAGLAELCDDHANFGLALDWALRENPKEALKLAASLGDYWFYRGHFTEGSDYLERALAQGECPKAYLWSGRLHQAKGDYSRALTEFEKSAKLATEPMDQARAYNACAQAGFTQGVYRDSVPYAEQALAIWREQNHERGECDTLSLLATAEICLGEWEEANKHLERCWKQSQKMEYQWGASMAAYLRGLSHLYEGRFEDSQQQLNTCLELCRELKTSPRTAVGLGNLGLCLLAQGKTDEAAAAIKEGREIAEDAGYKQVEAFLLYVDGYSHLRQGHRHMARQHLQQSLRLMKAMGVKESVELVLLCLAQTVEEPELSTTLRQAALTFKAENCSVLPAYLEESPPEYFDDALSLEEAVELGLRL